jgi:hypothetical protein
MEELVVCSEVKSNTKTQVPDKEKAATDDKTR